MARAFRSRNFGGGTKRHGDWAGSVPIAGLTSLAASTAVLSQIFIPTGAGETLIRTRGMFAWASDQDAAVEDQIGAIGIGIVTAQAEGVGVTAVPHPDTDSGWNGWLWHSYFSTRMLVGSSIGLLLSSSIVIDSKAMRKVGDEERLVVVVQNSGTSGMVFADQIRIYSKAF